MYWRSQKKAQCVLFYILFCIGVLAKDFLMQSVMK